MQEINTVWRHKFSDKGNSFVKSCTALRKYCYEYTEAKNTEMSAKQNFWTCLFIINIAECYK